MSHIPKTLLRPLLVTVLLVCAGLAGAAEETGEATAELDPGGPGGITTLIFLLGVAGILIVGGIHVARDSFRPDDET